MIASATFAAMAVAAILASAAATYIERGRYRSAWSTNQAGALVAVEVLAVAAACTALLRWVLAAA